MSTLERNPLESGGNDGTAVEQNDEQKIVALRSGQKIRVADAVWSCDNSLLKLIVEGNGVDVTVPRGNVELVIKSRAGVEVINDE